MATTIISGKNIISFSGGTNSGYNLTASYTATRTNSSTVKFTFTMTLKGVASSTHTAYGLRVSVKVGNSSTVNVDFAKNGTSVGQGPFTKTVSLNVSSSSAQTLTATFKGVKQAGSGTYRTLTASVKTPAASGGGGGGTGGTTTKCSPPTSLTSTGVASPGDYIAVEIYDGKGGTNNTLKGYDVYYKYGGQPTLSSYDGIESVDLDTPSGTQAGASVRISSRGGDTTYIKARSRGSAGASYYSDLSSAYTDCISSSPPYPPSVQAILPESTIPSTGGQVTFYVTPGADPDGDRTEAYYSRGGSRTRVDGSVTLTFYSTTTVHFYTYDGYDYSDSTDYTVYVNTKPTMRVSSTTTQSYNYNGSTYPFRFTLRATSDKLGTYYHYLVHNGTSYLVETSANSSVSDVCPSDYIENIVFGQPIEYRCRMYDGVEFSDYASTTLTTVPATYTSITRSYNQYANADLEGMNSSFFDKIRIYLPFDEIMTDPTCTVTYKLATGGNSYNASVVTYNNGTAAEYVNSTTYADLSIPTNMVSGADYTFTVTIAKGGLKRTYSITKTRTYAFPGGEISGIDTVKPFTNTSTYQISIPAPMNFISQGAFDFGIYNVGGVSDFSFFIEHGEDSSTPLICTDANTPSDFQMLAPTTTDDTVYFTVGPDVWFEALNEINLLDDVSVIRDTNVVIAVNHLFGAKARYITPLNANLSEPSSINSFAMSLDGAPLSSTSTELREGRSLTVNFDITSYAKQNFQIGIDVCRKSENVMPSEADTWTRYYTDTFRISGERDLETRKYNGSGSSTYQIPQVNSSNYVFFRLNVTDIYLNSYLSTPVAAGASHKHIPVNITLGAPEYTITDAMTEKGRIVIPFVINDSGGSLLGTNNLVRDLADSVKLYTTDPDLQSILQSDTLQPTIFDPLVTPNSITIDTVGFNASSLSLYLELTTHLSIDDTMHDYDKTLRTGNFVVYNLSPTLAVRYQHIGFNTTDFDDDVVFAMAAGDQGARHLFVFQSSTPGITPTIDIETGELNGFIIDGGNW